MSINDLKTEDTNGGFNVSSDKEVGHKTAGWFCPLITNIWYIAVRFWSLFAPCLCQACFFLFLVSDCCNLSANQSTIGKTSPLLSGPVSFTVADMAENRQRCKFITSGSFKIHLTPFSLSCCLSLCLLLASQFPL